MATKPDIEAVMAYYDLRIIGGGHGPWRKCQCPLPEHEDRNPSASVNLDKQFFKCHACDVAGDSYTIIERREGIGHVAARSFAQTTGFAEVAGEDVGSERGSSSLLPRLPGHRPGRRAFVPTWKRLG